MNQAKTDLKSYRIIQIGIIMCLYKYARAPIGTKMWQVRKGWGKEFWGYFCPEQGLSALNFRGGAEKVVVHMHWLTWLLWRHCIYI